MNYNTAIRHYEKYLSTQRVINRRYFNRNKQTLYKKGMLRRLANGQLPRMSTISAHSIEKDELMHAWQQYLEKNTLPLSAKAQEMHQYITGVK